jgi:hypothetical protein
LYYAINTEKLFFNTRRNIMAAPVVIAPVVAQAVVAGGLRIAIQAGAKYGLGVEIAGASALAASASTVILATGGAAAVVLMGYGLCQYLKSR